MANHEARPRADAVDLLLAFARRKDGVPNSKCIRTVIKDYDLDLALLEAKLRVLGGTWRIHKTVNKRDTDKARKWLIHKLIDNPEYAGCVDSLWRTALLQPNCIYGEKRFLLDVDTEEPNKIIELEEIIGVGMTDSNLIEKIKTPHGWHYITRPFDTREVCKLKYVSLIRDGYLFIKKVGD
jgi:hypothetical protein